MFKAYICGPTVYDSPHIGNLRPIVTFDIINRALIAKNEKVILIHNITDIDDKIINRAIELNESEIFVANKYYDEYLELLKSSNILRPNYMPRVTDNLSHIIDVIKRLIDKKFAYISEGNVLFDISKIPNYGHISGQNLDQMIFNENTQDKKNPYDFVLWKKTNKGITFDSPWSSGRPGWHTECVAFVDLYLNGDTLDYHGGGIDLIFPHHENEDAQYKGLHNKSITNSWKHTGQIFYNGQKMSKSLGNVILAKDFFEKYGADTFRMIILNSSFSGPINLSEELIIQNQKIVQSFKSVFLKSQFTIFKKEVTNDITDFISLLVENNFSSAMKLLHLTITNFNKCSSEQDAAKIITMMKLLGFGFSNSSINQENFDLYTSWQECRKAKNYEKADILRKKIEKLELF